MPSPDVNELTSRVARAQSLMREAGVDVLLLSPGADLRYLSGYAAIALERLTCLVLPAEGDPRLVVPRLEQPAAAASPAGEFLEIVVHEETDDAFRLVADFCGAAMSVGLANRMWAEQVLRFRSVMDAEQVTAGGVLRDLRMRKTATEVAALRAAGGAIDRVHARMGEWLQPGRTEAEVGRDIAEAIVAEGHETVNFVIVGSGPNGASPHHHVSERVINAGEPVVVDIGGTNTAGYCSDETRTYIAGGEPPDDFTAYYTVLEQAQRAACEAVRPGVTAAFIDSVARDIITDAGYGEYFVHRTGHGIGLEEHEDPYIVAGNDAALEPGMAFSVEPGIYLPGRHGARIEDILVVTEAGAEPLNREPHELAVLG
ncbi:MAG: M24 family metallopeptidase [Actinomycetes bacterium]